MNISLKSAEAVTGGELVMAVYVDLIGRVVRRDGEFARVRWDRTQTRKIKPIESTEALDEIRILGGGAA